MTELRKITQEQLEKILELHRKWVAGEQGGKIANLSEIDLTGAQLNGAQLYRAKLNYADLTGADLLPGQT